MRRSFGLRRGVVRGREVTLLALRTVIIGTVPWTPTAAQLAGSLALTSDVRLRGVSLNGGQPALTANLAYDHPSGVYLNAGLTGGDTRRFGVRFLNSTLNLGYAARLSTRSFWEVGAIDTRVSSNVLQRFSGNYTEVYAGIGSEQFSARLFYSPSFFRRDLQAAYLDLNGNLRLLPRVRGFGHFGLLIPLAGNGTGVLPRLRDDTRLGAAVELGRAEVQLTWVRSGAGAAFLEPRQQAANAVIVGASWFF